MIKTQKIVIVGGGSAGWMTAAALIKSFPERDITVVCSSDDPIIGVGESTIGGIKVFTNYIGIDEKDFLKETNASYKLSICFTDFYKKDSGSFHYPFGTAVIVGERNPYFDWHLKKYYYPSTPVQDFVNMVPSSYLFLNNKYSINPNGEFNHFDPVFETAYHFDATKFGAVLKNKYCVNKGVKYIDGTVNYIEVNEEGIEYLTLSNGQHIYADIFIDCTGFKSLLLDKTLKEEFISYEYLLPNNSAIAAQVQYEDKEKELQPYTNCTAIENGWCWNIPLWSRLGTGYVYSNKYTTKENALEEFKNYLTSDKMTIPRTRDQVDSLSYKYIDMRVGIHKKTFVKNVVAIGLSAGFIEPLESSGLYTVHEFLSHLINILTPPLIKQIDKDMYNNSIKQIFHGFAEFVAMHYSLSSRDDTPYWESVTSRECDFTYEGQNKAGLAKQSVYSELQTRYMFTWEHPYTIEGLPYIATGLHYDMLNEYKVALMEARQKRNFRNEIDEIQMNWEALQNKWSRNAEKAPTLFQYLSKLHI